MIAAETAFEAILAGDTSGAFLPLRRAFPALWAGAELWRVRNFHAGFRNGLLPASSTRRCRCHGRPRLRDPLPAEPGHTGCARPRYYGGRRRGDPPRYDGVLTFDKLTDVFTPGRSMTKTAGHLQWRHLDLRDALAAKSSTIRAGISARRPSTRWSGRTGAASACRLTRATACTARLRHHGSYQISRGPRGRRRPSRIHDVAGLAVPQLLALILQRRPPRPSGPSVDAAGRNAGTDCRTLRGSASRRSRCRPRAGGPAGLRHASSGVEYVRQLVERQDTVYLGGNLRRRAAVVVAGLAHRVWRARPAAGRERPRRP